MLLFVTLGDLRDVVIIVYGVIGIVFFFVAMMVALLLFLYVRSLLRTVRDLIRDNVKPTLDSVRDTARSVQGTTDFVGQSTVRPIIRTYSILAGVRRGAGVLSGLTGRKRS